MRSKLVPAGSSIPKTPPGNAPPEGESKRPLNPSPHDRKLALGAVLTFHRLIRELSRPQLSAKARMSVSLLGMIENGVRLPTQETLERMGIQLGLGAQQRLQLHAIAGYSAQLPEAPGWEVRADDVLNGNILFLRNLALESSFQDNLDIDEVWIVTRRPMALQEPVLSMLKRKLLNTDTRFVYFVDRRFGDEDFATLSQRLDLANDPSWVAKQQVGSMPDKLTQLAFVLSPPTLCGPTHTIAVFNPRSDSKPRFGRTVYYEGGTPIGVYAMDIVLVDQLVSLLRDVYSDCERCPGKAFPTDSALHGTFTVLTPGGSNFRSGERVDRDAFMK